MRDFYLGSIPAKLDSVIPAAAYCPLKSFSVIFTAIYKGTHVNKYMITKRHT